MFNMKKREVVLPAEITKTKKERVIYLNDELWEILLPYINAGHPMSFYLFGSGRPSGKGNIGLHSDFVPGPTQMKRDTTTKRWEKIVKNGLGINANLYSMK